MDPVLVSNETNTAGISATFVSMKITITPTHELSDQSSLTRLGRNKYDSPWKNGLTIIRPIGIQVLEKLHGHQSVDQDQLPLKL
ncbi:hypothetical protein AnigIFM50267_007060 [Aspergillus niger]|nr:hypothetical protein AnigIFM50267_007060 [Aspergillus niger]